MGGPPVENTPGEVSISGTARSEVKRYPLARPSTARNRDLRKATSRKLAATRLFSAKTDSKIELKASMRGKGMRANGISAQKTTNNAMATADARRRAPSGAGAVTRNAFDPLETLRSVTSLLRQQPNLAGKAPGLIKEIAARHPGRSRSERWRVGSQELLSAMRSLTEVCQRSRSTRKSRPCAATILSWCSRSA